MSDTATGSALHAGPSRLREPFILGTIILAGAALSWLSAAYPADMPAWAPWQFSWAEYLGTVLALLWYGTGVARMPPAERPAVWRQAAYGLGVIGMYAVVQTELTNLALHLFMATQAQQLVLHDLGPFLIALSWPGAALMRGMPRPARRIVQSRPVRAVCRIVQQPVIAALLFIGLLVAQVIPALMFRIMLDWRAFDAMNIIMAVDGVLFWCLVLDPRPRAEAGISYLTRVALAFLVMLPVMPIGGYITFTQHSYYGFYDLCGRLAPWISPMLDQRLGGIIFWIPGGLMSAFAVLLPLNAMRLSEEREERRQGKVLIQAGRVQIDPSVWTGR
ncbi:MAG TPA: cytochrome c oxidase assembly protein [Rhodopila sp.]|nr:cytochrome c oxidase assembly protein [Rhodopila sp.]